MKKKQLSVFLTLLILLCILSTQFKAKNFLLNDGEMSTDYIEIGNDKIFYEISGEGPAIIFIHDGLVHSAIWDDQISFFSKTHKVIRYDRRGYGNSTAATEAYSNVEDLNSIFNYFKIENACLVAMSSGGRLAINFTLKYPEKVNSLVLVGAVVGGFSYTKHFLTRGGHLSADLSGQEERRAYYASDDPYEIYSENVSAKEKVSKLIKDFPHKEGYHYTRSKPALQRLNEIKIATLILVGEFDIPDVHAHAGAITAGIPNSIRDIIPKAGHLIPIEKPDLFNQRVNNFLNGVNK
ncbi:alpha/beta fold hydrolase [Bacteroidota bacterium]